MPPIARLSPRGNYIAKILLAVCDDDNQASALEVTCFGNLAKKVTNIKEQSILLIIGHLQKDSWLRAAKKTIQYNQRIIADSVDVVDFSFIQHSTIHNKQ